MVDNKTSEAAPGHGKDSDGERTHLGTGPCGVWTVPDVPRIEDYLGTIGIFLVHVGGSYFKHRKVEAGFWLETMYHSKILRCLRLLLGRYSNFYHGTIVRPAGDLTPSPYGHCT